MSIFDRLSSNPGQLDPRSAQNITPSIFDRVQQLTQPEPEPTPVQPVQAQQQPGQTLAPGAGNRVTRSIYEQARGAFQALDDANETVANYILYGASKVADVAGIQDPRFKGSTLRGAMLERGPRVYQRAVGAVNDLLPGAKAQYDERGDIIGTAEGRSSVYAPEAIANMLGRQVPQVAMSANPAAAMAFATAQSGNNLNEFYENAKKRGLDDDAAVEAATAANSISLAGQAFLEKFSPLNRLMKEVGARDQSTLLNRLTMSVFREANTELGQQFIDEAIKIGLLPSEARTSEVYSAAVGSLLDSYILGGLSGGISQGAAEVPNALTRGGGQPAPSPSAPVAAESTATPTPVPAEGGSIFDRVATASDIRAAEALQEPQAPDAIRRFQPVDRQTKEPIEFASEYDKAKYIVENPSFRGKNKELAAEYVTAVDQYRNPQQFSPERFRKAAEGSEYTVRPENPPYVPVQDVQSQQDVPAPTQTRSTSGRDLPSSAPGSVEGQPAGQPQSTESVPPVTLIEPDAKPTKPTAERRQLVVNRLKQEYPDVEFDVTPANGKQAGLRNALRDRGIDVVYYSGQPEQAGKAFVMQAEPGVIFVDRDKNATTDELRASLLHEFGHELEFHHPAEWEAVRSAMTEYDIQYGEDIAYDRRQSDYSRRGVLRADRNPDQAMRDYDAREARVIPLERIANDPRIIRALEGESAGLWTKIKAWLKNFISNLRGTKDPLLNETLKVLEQTLDQPLYTKEATIRDTSPAPSNDVRAVAAAYAREANLPLLTDQEYVKVDTARAKQIADWYERGKHNPTDPKVKASYDALINETKDQFVAIRKAGYKLEPWTGEGPAYKSSKDMMKDVNDNKHLYYDPTDRVGFGSNEQASTNHPMLQMVDVDGQPMVANDLFRAVHDFFGHAKEGTGFGPRGEENAWRQHSVMYSELARPAMTTETRGQNSWVNYGPQGEQNRRSPENTTFAEQKAMLAPDWMVKNGAAFRSDDEVTRPKTSYGYWFIPGQGWRAVGYQGHEDGARDSGFRSTADAIDAGAVRVVSKPDADIEIEVSGLHPESLEGIKPLIREALVDGKGIGMTVLGEDPINIRRGTPKQTGAIAFDQASRGEFDAARATADGARIRQFFTPTVSQPKPTIRQRVADLFTSDVQTESPRAIVREAREEARGETAAQNVQSRDAVFEFDKAIKSEFGKTFADITDTDRAGLLAAIKGAPIPYANYGPELQSAVDRMRQQIDENTDELIKQLRAAGNPASRQLANTLQTNRGFYANLSYRLFEKPAEQIKAVMEGKGRYKPVYDDYYTFIEQKLVKAGIPTPSKLEVEGAMRQTLESLAGEGVLGKGVTGQGLSVPVTGRKPVGILKHRKALPAELRAAMGQNLNAPIVYQMTVAKQAALIAAHGFQQRLVDEGAGKWLFKQPVGEFTQPLATDDPRNPLAGYYTAPEVAKLVAEYKATPGATSNWLLWGWRKANAISRQSATVGSTAAAGANYIGQPGFLIANGIFSPTKLLRVFTPGKVQLQAMLEGFPTTRKVMDNLFGIGSTDAATRAEIDKLTRLGLLNDSVFARDALEAARELGLDPNTLADKGKLGKLIDAGMFPVKMGRALYNLSDTRAKLLIYEDAVQQLTKAFPGRSQAEIESEAADRAKNTYPSYERTYGWAKEVSRSGVIGPFAPFMADIYRTTRNNLAYGMKDMIEGSKRWNRGEQGGSSQFLWGLRRYLGTSFLLSGVAAIASGLSATLGGLDDDEEDRLRESLPPWLKNTTGFFVKTEDGKYQYYNMSRYLPVLALTDTVRSLVEDSIPEGIATAAQPFISEQLVTSKVLDVARNATPDGRPVYNPEETDTARKVEDIAKHILGPVVPDIIRRPINRLIPAFQGATDARGKPLDFEDELLKAVGFTVTTVDPEASLGFQSSSHKARNRNAITIFTNAIKNLGTPDEEDVLDAYNRMEDARLKIWKDTYNRIQSARESGRKDNEIRKTLRMGTAKSTEPSGLSTEDVDALMSGRYRPYNFLDNDKFTYARQRYGGKVPQGKLVDEAKRRRQMRLDTK